MNKKERKKERIEKLLKKVLPEKLQDEHLAKLQDTTEMNEILEFKKLIDNLKNSDRFFSLTAKDVKFLFKSYNELCIFFIILVISAMRKQEIGYYDLVNLAKQYGVDLSFLPTRGQYIGNFLGTVLGLISLHEFFHGRPLLSVIVINQGTKMPSDGFFNLAKGLKLFDANYQSKQTFRKKERERVGNFWN